MNRFAGKLAVVAGGARGMGAACAGRLAAAGAAVAVLDHAAAEPVDVTSEQQVTEFFSALPRPPDVMVNAVGNANLALIEDQAAAEFRRIVDIELVGAYICLRAAARVMISGRVAGSIVTFSSVNATYPSRGLSGHCSAKAGVDQLTRVAAVELGRYGIRVNAVAPGCTLTPLTAPFAGLPSYADAVAVSTPLGSRMGDPDEVADVVMFLASDDARWVTGRTLTADGGQSLVFLPDPLGALDTDGDGGFESQVVNQTRWPAT